MKKRGIKIIAVLLTFALLFSMTTAAFGYRTADTSIYSRSNTYKYRSSINGNAKSAFESAIGDWNHAGLGIKFTYSPSSKNELYSVYISGGSAVEGKTFFSGTSHKMTTGKIREGRTNFSMYINTAYSNTSSRRYRSVACHEIGHLLGLADTTGYTCIMNPNRSRTSVYEPKSNDKAGIRAVWGIK